MTIHRIWARLLLLVCIPPVTVLGQGGAIGVFTKSADIGDPALKGSVQFASGRYIVTGSGTNIWGKHDQFRFVWREMSGNFSVTATLHFLGQGVEHRKAGIMVRQSLDPDASYADVLIHGSGMPALQWRSRKGEDTNTFDLPAESAGTIRVKLVRVGVKVYLYLGAGTAEPQKIANTEVTFQDPVLVGLVVCSHAADHTDTVEISDVAVEEQASVPVKTQH